MGQTRAVGSECFLEACVENGAKAPLVLDYVRFDPTPGLLAAPVVRSSSSTEALDQEPLGGYVQSLQVALLSCLVTLCHIWDALALMDSTRRPLWYPHSSMPLKDDAVISIPSST